VGTRNPRTTAALVTGSCVLVASLTETGSAPILVLTPKTGWEAPIDAIEQAIVAMPAEDSVPTLPHRNGPEATATRGFLPQATDASFGAAALTDEQGEMAAALASPELPASLDPGAAFAGLMFAVGGFWSLRQEKTGASSRRRGRRWIV